jgi:uncharacterized protein (TIGR03083 family)
VNIEEYLSSLDDAGMRLRSAAAAAGLDAPVPSCPGWVVRDLVRHQGSVHRWATGYVAGPRTEYWDVDVPELVGAWPADDDLLDWFTAGHATLIDTLRAADPDLACWTFLAAPSPVAMWARRQAHETTVHRVDAELAAGREPAKVPAAFAANGVDELLTCFITRPSGTLRADPAQTLAVSCTDDPGVWLVSIKPDQVATSAGDDARAAVATAACHLRGGAHELYLALWHRRPFTGIIVEGDAGVLDSFNEQVRVTWS